MPLRGNYEVDPYLHSYHLKRLRYTNYTNRIKIIFSFKNIESNFTLFLLGDCYCKKYKTLFPRNNKKGKQPRNKEKSLDVMRIYHKPIRGMLRYVEESKDIYIYRLLEYI